MGISCAELAEKTGVSLQTVERYEKTRSPSFEFLLTLINTFGIRSNYFFDQEDEIIFKKDEIIDKEIVESVREVGVELGYLRSEVAEIKEWKRKIEKEGS